MRSKRRVFKALDIVVGLTALSSVLVLLNATGVYAESDAIDTVTVTVPVSCSITNTVDTAHTATVEVGTYTEDIGETTFKVLCNDSNGFAVYVIGYSDDTYGNTVMKPSTLTDTNAIATGIATSGSTSNWAMKLTAVSGDYTPALATGFNDYHAVPAEYTKVASLDSSTDATVGSSFKSTYAAFVSQAQPADTYTGKVKYTVVHPADAAEPEIPIFMQEATSADCTSTPRTVYDNRDGHSYVIQRLADGNCWMMENLDLGRTELTTDLTSANTNLSTTVAASTFNGWKKTSGTGAYTVGEFISVSGADSISGTAYGTLYNYYAASARTIAGSTNSSNASYDICPAGWRLPTGGDSGEFQALYTQYNSNSLMRAPIASGGAAFALAGSFFNTAPGSQGSIGGYWSSTMSNSTKMHYLYLNTSDINPTSGGANRYSGLAIRCILKEPLTISKLTHMQDFNNLTADDKTSVLASMEDNTTYNLKDIRDNKTYAIAKMKDGRIWMAENLDLGRTELTTDLTSANSNLSTTITAVTFNSWKKTAGTQTYDAGEFYNVSGFDEVSSTPYGTLYNYYAASAGTITGSSNNSNSTFDICPAGWHLPSSDSSGEFQALYAQYNSVALMRAPIENGGAAFALAGRVYDGAPAGQNSFGYYWSSTKANSTLMKALYLGTSNVSSGNNENRFSGVAIRCVAK